MSRLTAPPWLLGLLGLLGLLALPSPAASAGPPVTIYRCTDARGHLTLRDSPCRPGERQDVRTMLRPTDPPPSRAVATRARDRGPAVLPPTHVVYRTAPRPVYECVTPDGERYTSGSPEGNPRWVPLWTLGHPVVGVAPPAVEGGYGARVEHRDGGTRIRVDAGRRWRYPGYGGVPVATAGGTWVRDACEPLPASEACALLRDRRDALDRRWFSALQGDRDAIEREQRRIDAQLGESCP
ncbi:DUF4124 domain-containing protein [Cognatilysobacter segetis]|uniref:DUF4124 domain-containing protein n=1 Tax=Cognatilysobacter segetis TaxID=2492394 RepID=UPI00105C6CE5|nr:DUF4124 domain-containing protein [Lysobacter segetis]